MSDNRHTVTVVIENLTEAQQLALEDLFATWVQLGGQGSSRWTAFFADGDGNFRPRITVNGRKASHCAIGRPRERWRSMAERDVYAVDFDEIARFMMDQELAPNG